MVKVGGESSAGVLQPDVLRIQLGSSGGPSMTSAIVDACLDMLAASDVTAVDLEGPPPELHPRFRDVVILVRALRRRLLHRCSLPVIAQREARDLPELLAEHQVEVIGALPPPQMGAELSATALEGLRRLGDAGYGRSSEGPQLHLVAVADRGWQTDRLAEALEGRAVPFNHLHVVAYAGRALEDLDAALAALPEMAAAVPAGRVLGIPCRSILTVAPDGAMFVRAVDSGDVPLGRTVEISDARFLCVPGGVPALAESAES